MIKPLQLAFMLLLIMSLKSFAQTQTMTGFTNFHKKALTPIYEGKEVKGYIMFYKADKADKRLDNYGLDFFDENLKKVKSVVLPKERNRTLLLRSSFNGEAFSFYFFNTGKKMFEIDVFDRSLNKIASKQMPKTSQFDLKVVQQEIMTPGNGDNNPVSGMNLYAVPNKGFIRNGYLYNMKGYSLEMYDNNLNLKWTYVSDSKSKDCESIQVQEITEKYVLATVARRPSVLSQKLEFFLTAFDVVTGKKLLDLAVEKDKNEQLSLSSFGYDEALNEYIATGEYYKLNDKPMVNKSLGFFVKRIGQDGEDKIATYYSWEKDINPLLPQEAKKTLDDGYVNFVHRIIRGADGRQHIVAEQYKLKPNGMGIAMSLVVGGANSLINSTIGNLMIFTLEPDLKLGKVSFFGKDPSEYTLPPGAPFGTGLVGYIINLNGGFSYQFTQQDNDFMNFNTTFINRKDIKKSKYDEKTLVNIMYTGDSEFLTDRVDISSSKLSKSYVYPAKPGYVLVLNQQEEEKKVEMKLVKLNK